MITQIKGKVIQVFSDDINTDDIVPAWTLQESSDRVFFGKYAFRNYDAAFIQKCSKNKSNIIVAGKNFGCGSSREQAVYALRENNVSAVIAESFPDIFYRNALNNGLIVIALEDISPLIKDMEIAIDLEKKTIRTNRKIIPFIMSETDAKTLMLGGKLAKVRTHLQEILKTTQSTKQKVVNTIKGKEPKHNVIGQTIAEKIISAHLGKTTFAKDRLERLPVDILFFNEVIGPAAIKDYYFNFSDIYKKNQVSLRVFDPKKILFVPDHTVPSSSVAVSEGIKFMKEFARQQRIKCYKEGDGIEHVVLIEEGFSLPGKIILGTDSHTDTNGALNALAFGVGTTDASYALATGNLYDFEVPQTFRINLKGKLKKGVYTKDMILTIIGRLGVDGACRKAVEFGGPGLVNLSMDARTTIANMAVEMGARTAIFEFDSTLEKYIKERAKFLYTPFFPDKNCHYEKVLEIDLSSIEPVVAFPHKPSNVTPISQITDFMEKTQKSKSADMTQVYSLKITDAFLGACTNGRYEDFIEASKVLKGKKVHQDVNFVAIPASRNIYKRLLKERILEIFADAGVNIESSNCGPCFGKHMGVVGRGAKMISSSNRNYIGRMGSKDAQIFLASPATVAASAVAGKITDPRKYL